MSDVITPTVGRRVWFWSSSPSAQVQPYDAGIAYVHSDRMINISWSDHQGNMRSQTSVPLVQPGDLKPSAFYCEWMPYQVGQVKKHKGQPA